MRTTLTIDDDVAAEMERLQKARGLGLKELVNEALRRGLREMTARKKPGKVIRTRSLSLGRAYRNIDNIAEAIATAESETFK